MQLPWGNCRPLQKSLQAQRLCLPADGAEIYLSRLPPAYSCISSSHFENRRIWPRSLTRNFQKSFGSSASAFLPEYVSSLHRRYGLRQGFNRYPRAAFHRNWIPLNISSVYLHFMNSPRLQSAALAGAMIVDHEGNRRLMGGTLGRGSGHPFGNKCGLDLVGHLIGG